VDWRNHVHVSVAGGQPYTEGPSDHSRTLGIPGGANAGSTSPRSPRVKQSLNLILGLGVALQFRTPALAAPAPLPELPAGCQYVTEGVPPTRIDSTSKSGPPIVVDGKLTPQATDNSWRQVTDDNWSAAKVLTGFGPSYSIVCDDPTLQKMLRDADVNRDERLYVDGDASGVAPTRNPAVPPLPTPALSESELKNLAPTPQDYGDKANQGAAATPASDGSGNPFLSGGSDQPAAAPNVGTGNALVALQQAPTAVADPTDNPFLVAQPSTSSAVNADNPFLGATGNPASPVYSGPVSLSSNYASSNPVQVYTPPVYTNSPQYYSEPIPANVAANCTQSRATEHGPGGVTYSLPTSAGCAPASQPTIVSNPVGIPIRPPPTGVVTAPTPVTLHSQPTNGQNSTNTNRVCAPNAVGCK
jgi:hypothetical protein